MTKGGLLEFWHVENAKWVVGRADGIPQAPVECEETRRGGIT